MPDNLISRCCRPEYEGVYVEFRLIRDSEILGHIHIALIDSGEGVAIQIDIFVVRRNEI